MPHRASSAPRGLRGHDRRTFQRAPAGLFPSLLPGEKPPSSSEPTPRLELRSLLRQRRETRPSGEACQAALLPRELFPGAAPGFSRGIEGSLHALFRQRPAPPRAFGWPPRRGSRRMEEERTAMMGAMAGTMMGVMVGAMFGAMVRLPGCSRWERRASTDEALPPTPRRRARCSS